MPTALPPLLAHQILFGPLSEEVAPLALDPAPCPPLYRLAPLPPREVEELEGREVAPRMPQEVEPEGIPRGVEMSVWLESEAERRRGAGLA